VRKGKKGIETGRQAGWKWRPERVLTERGTERKSWQRQNEGKQPLLFLLRTAWPLHLPCPVFIVRPLMEVKVILLIVSQLSTRVFQEPVKETEERRGGGRERIEAFRPL